MDLLAMQVVEKIDPVEMERRFYEEPFKFSYSSLNKLLYNPERFYNDYILKLREELTDKHLVEGKLVHLLIVRPLSFDKFFVKMPGTLPSANVIKVLKEGFKAYQNRKNFFKSDVSKDINDYKPVILHAMTQLDFYQALKDDKDLVTGSTGDQKRLAKVLTPDALTYWEFLLIRGDRDVVDEDTFQYCKQLVEKVRQNKKVMRLLGLLEEEFSDNEVFQEEYFECNLENYDFGLKGYIDTVFINHFEKVITITDIKTSSKPLKSFPDSVEYFGYWMQAVIYILLVKDKFKHLVDQGYKVQFYFTVIDVNGHVYPYPVSSKTINDWFLRFSKDALLRASFHYDTASYGLPYEFVEGAPIL